MSESPGFLRMRLIQRLRSERASQQLTLEAVASRARVHHRTIARWEGGETEPGLADVILWARALGLFLDFVDRTELSHAEAA